MTVDQPAAVKPFDPMTISRPIRLCFGTTFCLVLTGRGSPCFRTPVIQYETLKYRLTPTGSR